jgi:transglutaminase-like putative cysteine protease
MEEFLRETEIIDWRHPAVLSRARELSGGASNTGEIARRCFDWVRDEIQHSGDFRRNPVTCTASEVLIAGTGWCYGKSHLLAALLRANGIPAGLCYQRLSISDDGGGPPYSLHGLNAVWLPEYGWYRVDARGNKPGVDAQFTPPAERLAFRAATSEERDFAEILPDPLEVVVAALRKYRDWEAVWSNLPDWEFPSLPVG